MRSSELIRVVVAFDETADVDLNVVVIVFCFQRVGTPGCAKLRPVHPRPGFPVFKLTGEPLKVNFQWEKAIRGRVSHRQCPPRVEILEYPLRIVAISLFVCEALLLELLQSLLISPSLFQHPLVVYAPLFLHCGGISNIHSSVVPAYQTVASSVD